MNPEQLFPVRDNWHFHSASFFSPGICHVVLDKSFHTVLFASVRIPQCKQWVLIATCYMINKTFKCSENNIPQKGYFDIFSLFCYFSTSHTCLQVAKCVPHSPSFLSLDNMITHNLLAFPEVRWEDGYNAHVLELVSIFSSNPQQESEWAFFPNVKL